MKRLVSFEEASSVRFSKKQRAATSTRSLLRRVAGGRGVGARSAAALEVRRTVVVHVVVRAIAILVIVGAPFSGVVASRRRVVVALERTS